MFRVTVLTIQQVPASAFIPSGDGLGSKMLHWPRELRSTQNAVIAAGDDVDRVLRIILKKVARLMPYAEGGEIELVEGKELICRANWGKASKRFGHRSASAINLPGFCSILAQRVPVASPSFGVAGHEDDAPEYLRSSIIAPIPYESEFVGVIRVHSSKVDAFDNTDLLGLQLLAGLISLGLAREAITREEQARELADRRFKATFEQAAVGIAHVSPEGRFIRVNDRFCEIAGYAPDALMSGGFQRITHPEDLEADLALVGDLLHGRIQNYSMEKRYIREDGAVVWVNLTVSLVRDELGQPDFFVSVIEDITARREAEVDAEHDHLTGLLNRRGALRRLESMMLSDSAWNNGLAVAFIDLDGFKAINDAFGHLEGDRCLIKVAKLLSRSLRSGDILARLGGDEFVALFPARTEEAVRYVLERLQAEMAGVSEGEDWQLGASVGVAIAPAESKISAQDLITAADKLMYKAKQSRDHVPVIAVMDEDAGRGPKPALA